MNFDKICINGFYQMHMGALVLMAIVVIGIYLGFKREFSKLIGFLGSCLDCCRLGVQRWRCERCTVRAIQQDYWLA